MDKKLVIQRFQSCNFRRKTYWNSNRKHTQFALEAMFDEWLMAEDIIGLVQIQILRSPVDPIRINIKKSLPRHRDSESTEYNAETVL